ncbi:MAG TPA: tetratricopeptide repeat protein, partial [Tepidisphaeraceae bacterium]|nr:tetratricopeptide repeat protein [Tepidisphaeraceae bacterium]
MTIQELLNLALQRHLSGHSRDAESLYRQVLMHDPHNASALNLLGLLQRQAGQYDEAIVLIRRAVGADPNNAQYRDSLGLALVSRGLLKEAVNAFQSAVELKPDWAEAHNNLGSALRELGRVNEAIACFKRSTELQPQTAEFHYNLAAALAQAKKNDEGLAANRRAVQLKPDWPQAQANLGYSLAKLSKLDEAIESLNKALALKPGDVYVLSNLGKTYMDAGRVDLAIQHYEKALAIDPTFRAADSNRVYALYFDPRQDSQSILTQQKLWNERHGARLATEPPPHQNGQVSARRLRIGYVSPAFRSHVVGRNVLPLLRAHDRERFEVFCYSNIGEPDHLTNQFRAAASVYRDIRPLTDDQAAEAIRTDRIDILVDLSLHLADNRLGVIARKPAPVQATFAGYPGGTGLTAIDWRLTDPYLDPPGQTDGDYVERSYRLRHSFWCYDPDVMAAGAPLISPLPASRNGYVTFGCMNNFSKVNDATLERWSRVLQATPKSHLLLMAPEGSARQRTLETLSRHGISSERVEFTAFSPMADYFRTYGRIDIGLDTLPYNGHSTSLDSFWMGVPVVTQIGGTVVGRAGWSQVSNLSLTELAASDDEQFVNIAVELAADLPRLAELRMTLRD